MTTKQQSKTKLEEAIKGISSVDMGWITLDILFKKKLKAEHEECLGYVDFDLSEIHILEGMSERVLRATFLHECLHTILSTMGVRAESEDVHEQITITNEFITEQTTRGLLIFKKLNPKIWGLIFDD